MRTGNDGAALRGLATLCGLGTTRDLTDGQLLERYATGSGEAAELAFEALVERHGAMVLRVCRAHLPDPHDAHDAFQATFLVLVRKARGVWVRDSLGPWLHQVARRVALRARATAARRRIVEQKAAERTPNAHAPEPGPGFDLEEALHEEIDRLPDRHRIPIILCDLQGLSCEEAARRMGRPVGTVKSWRARGRERLRSRLVRRGLAPSVGLVASITTNAAPVEATIRPAVRLVLDSTTAGEVSASVQGLARGVLKAMFINKLKAAAVAALAVVFLAGGLGAAAWGVAEDSPAQKTEARTELPKPAPREESESWVLPFDQAVQLGLSHSDSVRVVPSEKGAPFTIAPREPGDEPEFKVLTTTLARAIGESYWTLKHRLAATIAMKHAAELTREVVDREEAKIAAAGGNAARVAEARRRAAEARRRLEDLNRDAETREADAIASERRLRELLGVPVDDGRRIAPVPPPIEELTEPDWEEAKAHMRNYQPGIARARAKLKEAADDLSSEGLSRVEEESVWLQRVMQESLNELARRTLEVDANHRMFQNATKIRVTAARELDAERAKYEAGKVSPNPYLKAIAEHARAAVRASEFRRLYNIAQVDFYEYKGTLLELNEIVIADAPEPTPRPAHAEPKNVGGTGEATGKTYSFQFTVGLDPKPIEIRGSLTIAPAR